jgi:pimeloyl-ACP methyl ester carboxylesterase
LALAAAPGRTLNKLIRDQLQFRMKEAGKPDAEIAALLARLDRTVRQMMSGSAEFVTDKFDPANPYEAVVLGLTKQPEFVVPLFINDPLQVVNNVKAPVLILQGEKDWQTSVKDAQYLNESLTRSYHSDHTLRLFPEVDHLLKTNKGAAGTASYADTTRPLDAELLTFLHEWLQKRSK